MIWTEVDISGATNSVKTTALPSQHLHLQQQQQQLHHQNFVMNRSVGLSTHQHL